MGPLIHPLCTSVLLHIMKGTNLLFYLARRGYIFGGNKQWLNRKTLLWFIMAWPINSLVWDVTYIIQIPAFHECPILPCLKLNWPHHSNLFQLSLPAPMCVHLEGSGHFWSFFHIHNKRNILDHQGQLSLRWILHHCCCIALYHSSHTFPIWSSKIQLQFCDGLQGSCSSKNLTFVVQKLARPLHTHLNFPCQLHRFGETVDHSLPKIKFYRSAVGSLTSELLYLSCKTLQWPHNWTSFQIVLQ